MPFKAWGSGNYASPCTFCPQKQSQRIFKINFIQDWWISLKFVRLIPESTHDTTASCISNDACVIPLPETFSFNGVLKSWTTDRSNALQKAGPFDCCCSRQSVASPSLCLCQGPRWIFWAHLWCFHGSVCWVNAEHSWLWGLTVWLFCLSSKCNLSETFYQVWALRRWGERHNHRQTRSCLKSLCQKLERLVAVLWRCAKK